MSATTKRASNGASSAPVRDLAAEVAALEVTKPARVYVDVEGVPRVPTAEGTLATIQREQRADGSLGEYLLTEIRTNKDKSESAQRYSILRVQALKDALTASGVKFVR